MPGPTPEQSKTPPSRPWLVALFICANALLVAYSLHVFYWTPSPLGADAPAGAFSEARARRHVQVLTEEIGLRSVSTPGLQQAHNYIWDFCQQLQQKALDLDITVQAEFETYTGSFSFDFVGERFINAYHNISNIILHISKKGHQQDPAVLLVAHHDSPVGSPGAGDDASNIGVMMELAANMVADPDKLSASPVMFLFSGAEEPLCQSAAAFMQHSPWVSRVGVFINLESIGPGGAPIVFQHAGAWVIEAYGKGARYPRGAIAAQDVFDAGLVLGDTDYRQLSYRHRGGLPGIDIAHLLSGAAYHTDRDTLDAIRPGVLQETGETLTGAVRSLAEALATARQQSPDSLQELLGPKDHKRMFLSLGGRYMLTYSLDTAMMLHNVPLIFTLTAPWTLRLMNPAWSLPASEGFMAMLYSLLVSSWTLIAVLVLPAGLGALRAWASGKAMVWFANHYIVLLTYCPLAVAILLLPWSRMDYSQGRGKQLLAYHVLGAALLNSILASVLTRFGIGLSMIFGLWGAAGAATGCIVAQGISVSTLLGTLLSCAWPIYTCSETAVVMAVVLMSRMSLTGHVFIAMGDAIVGVLLGLGAVSLSGCCLLPVLQALMGESSRKLAAVLAVTAVIMSLAVSLSEVAFPYSRDMPKRLMLGHVHYTAAAVDAQQESVGPVPMTVVNSSWVVAGSDSNSAGMLAEAMGFNLSTAQVATGNEWGMIYPVSKLLDLVLFPAKPSVGVVEHLPHVQLVNQRTLNQQEQSAVAGAVSSIPGEVIELELEVFTEKPCWGTLRLFGADMVSWSITPGVWTDAATFLASDHGGSGSALISKNRAEGLHVEKPRKEDGVLRSLVVKWTNEHQQGPLQWPLKVRVARSDLGSTGQNDSTDSAGSDDHRPTGLTVELQVGYVERTAALAEIEARMPEWSTLSYEATTYISKWDF